MPLLLLFYPFCYMQCTSATDIKQLHSMVLPLPCLSVRIKSLTTTPANVSVTKFVQCVFTDYKTCFNAYGSSIKLEDISFGERVFSWSAPVLFRAVLTDSGTNSLFRFEPWCVLVCSKMSLSTFFHLRLRDWVYDQTLAK